MNNKDKNNDIEKKERKPHDKFFQLTFSNPEIASDFLANYLPASILKSVDLETLEIQPGSYITDEFKEFSSDMLYKADINGRDGYLYFLFEHKSYPDRMVALQLFLYIARILDQKVNRENDTHIPVVIPMVIYHGKNKWKIGQNLTDLILNFDTLPEEIRQLIPDYRYQLYDLSQFSDDDIKGEVKLSIIFSIFRDMSKNRGVGLEATILEAARAISALDEKEKGIEFFKIYMEYIIKAGSEISNDQLKVVIKQLGETYKEGSEVVMTLAEALRNEGREEMREKIQVVERNEAKLELALDFATTGLMEKFGLVPDEFREKINGMDLIALKTLISKINRSTDLDEVRKFLNL